MAAYKHFAHDDIDHIDTSHLHPGYQPHYTHNGVQRLYENEPPTWSGYYDHGGEYDIQKFDRRSRPRRRSVDSHDDLTPSYHHHHSQSDSRSRSLPRSQASRRSHDNRSRSHRRSYSPESTGSEQQARRRHRRAASNVDIRPRRNISPSPEHRGRRRSPPPVRRSRSAEPNHGKPKGAAAGHGHFHKPTDPHARHAMEVALGNAARAAFRVTANDSPVPHSVGSKVAKVAGVALASYLVDYTLDRNAKQHPLKHIGVSRLHGAVLDHVIDGHGFRNMIPFGHEKHKESPF